jgi:LemA protein
MAKKKINKGLWITIAVIVLIILIFMGSYNGLVNADEEVIRTWGNVESAYQRRADLIPNLVETVKAYKIHEEEVLTEITKARSQIGSATTPAGLSQGDAALTSAIGRLLLVVENYPDLKANENFLSLQDELAGTENRVKVERDNYNGAVKKLNTKVRKFPSNIIANLFGFEKKDPFEAVKGSEIAPEVSFE